jgi:Ca2+-binding RTX toxin-like protein
MKQSNRSARVKLEALEDRLTPATIVSGDLVIVGNNSFNTVFVEYEVVGGVGYYNVTESGDTQSFAASSVWGGDVYFYGYGGNDYFRNDTALRAVAYGGDGIDTLVGGSNADWLDGGNDTDFLYGEGGNDTLWAGFDGSSNQLKGGQGNDQLNGGYGSDVMYGEQGNDKLVGSLGADYLYGGADDDVLDGGDDGVHDQLIGGAGRDSFQQDWYGGLTFFGNRDKPIDYDIWLDSYFNNPPPPA